MLRLLSSALFSHLFSLPLYSGAAVNIISGWYSQSLGAHVRLRPACLLRDWVPTASSALNIVFFGPIPLKAFPAYSKYTATQLLNSPVNEKVVGIRPPPSRVLLIMHGISNFLMLAKVWVRKGGHCSALLSLCVTSPSLNCEAFLTNLSLLPTETPQISVLLPFSHEQKSLFQVGLIKMPRWGFQI